MPERGSNVSARAAPAGWVSSGGGNGDGAQGAGAQGLEARLSRSALAVRSSHNSIMADVLKKNPKIYESLKEKVTSKGVTFAACIKPGMDVTPKMEMELAKTIGRRFESEQRPVGLVAGDDECYEMFDALFSEVMRRCNEGREAPGVAAQPIELEPRKVRDTNDVDPAGRFVVSCTVDGRRNIATVALLPGANTNALMQRRRASA